ncbi:acetyl-CoA carboxylase biotin carboxyl carrier protein [bacterium]|nr:acetyl-CoA carboxylase biotin carboxyl carrier protein [bacterium]MBU1881403.1 acetyl-CoA carboxylase biotin carboxyl carrier protein [bacterium]
MFDLKEVKKLVRLLEQSQISEIEISDKDRKIRLTKSTQGDAQSGQTIITAPPAPPPVDTLAPAAPKAVGANIKLVKSPMVGSYYTAPSPDSEPYVQVGDHVRKGQVLCIIEAMKLMNELECEFDGRIVDMHVENAQPVEFDHLLFTIETA